MSREQLQIALAAGGTGGHLFSAIALAESLLARRHRVSVLTDGRGAKFGADVQMRAVPATRMKGGLLGKAVGAVRLAMGVIASAWHLKRDRCSLLVGFGGYPSVPPVLAAKLLGIPVILVEQNAILGRANSRLARWARVIATAFPNIEKLGATPHKFTGIPVRPAVVTARAIPYTPSLTEAPFELLVFGGSQGAHVFAEVMPKACTLLPGNLRRRLRITQQTRPDDEFAVRSAYAELGVCAHIATFFDDLPAHMGRSHLVIARAGASTIAEVLTIGRPAVLVPYPHAMDDHQTANARAIDAAGAAWLMPQSALTPEAIAQRLETLLTLPDCAAQRAALAFQLGCPDAAEALADLAESVLKATRPAFDQTLQSVAS